MANAGSTGRQSIILCMNSPKASFQLSNALPTIFIAVITKHLRPFKHTFVFSCNFPFNCKSEFFNKNSVFFAKNCVESAKNSKQCIFWTFNELQTCKITHETTFCNILVCFYQVFCALDAKQKQFCLFLSVFSLSRKCCINFNVGKLSDPCFTPQKNCALIMT